MISNLGSFSNISCCRVSLHDTHFLISFDGSTTKVGKQTRRNEALLYPTTKLHLRAYVWSVAQFGELSLDVSRLWLLRLLMFTFERCHRIAIDR